nr:hypothetical protein RSP673_06065 [Ralstonia solanacearum P673]
MLAGIDHTADADHVTGLEAADLRADLPNLSDDLVARNDGIGRKAAVVTRQVEVRMTDPAIQDVDHDVIGSRGAPFKRKRLESIGSRRSSIAQDFHGQ